MAASVVRLVITSASSFRWISAGRPALIHLKLDADVITSRTTLAEIRRKAEARLKA